MASADSSSRSSDTRRPPPKSPTSARVSTGDVAPIHHSRAQAGEDLWALLDMTPLVTSTYQPSFQGWQEAPSMPNSQDAGAGSKAPEYQTNSPNDVYPYQMLQSSSYGSHQSSDLAYTGTHKRKASLLVSDEEPFGLGYPPPAKRARPESTQMQGYPSAGFTQPLESQSEPSGMWPPIQLHDWPISPAWKEQQEQGNGWLVAVKDVDDLNELYGIKTDINPSLGYATEPQIDPDLLRLDHNVQAATSHNTNHSQNFKPMEASKGKSMASQPAGIAFSYYNGPGDFFTTDEFHQPPPTHSGSAQSYSGSADLTVPETAESAHAQQGVVKNAQVTLSEKASNTKPKPKRKSKSTLSGRTPKARMNTTRLKEDARPPMNQVITVNEIAVFNQKWMVNPALAVRLQQNKVTGPMMSTLHLDAIGKAKDSKLQTAMKNKIKKEYSQGGMYALKCSEWDVTNATKLGPESDLTANNWQFRDFYRYRNGDTKKPPKQVWKDYPLRLFYSHIDEKKWPTGQDRGVMTRVFEHCKRKGLTDATTAEWGSLIQDLPAEPDVTPQTSTKNLDQKAVDAYFGRV
ncbi:hypothetical protein CBER1_05042 [Cercospora berteroae]|uniref:Uncharacterized protein n=1 Tax=Cercospora berteroae TaxID=357750 RepID=A0A2S6BRI6_9PEZI|nr:hypothetical protein CBER1_05042 [Cercospora berteroae]